MEFNKKEWNAPSKVYTPNIDSDIQCFLGSDTLSEWKNSSNRDLKEMIIVITERLEFISHLTKIAHIVSDCSKREYSILNSIEITTFECKYQGHDFAGVQFDIDALCYYLYLSCIDAIQSQSQYKSAFEYISDNVSKYENKTSEELLKILNTEKGNYSEIYGLSRNFIKAFTDEISISLKTQIINNIIVVKIRNNNITQDSIKAWEDRHMQKKLYKIAAFLYSMRSLYTHKNIRSFLPTKPLEIVPETDGEILLCKKEFSIQDLLNEVIRELCLRKLKINN